MTVLAFLQAGGGLALLFIGGEVLLRGAVGLALRFGLSPLLIGLTVVAMATSMPELVVTVTAGLRDAQDLGVGNIVGSNIANILLILGLAAVISPIEREPRRILRDALAMTAATAALLVLARFEPLTVPHGLVMIALMGGYLVMSYVNERRGGNEAATGLESIEEAGRVPKTAWLAGALVAGGVLLLVGGSELLVRGATTIARAAGVSEAVIGLTLVAIGTSLPELATSLVAALRGHTEVALGNVLGSNIFNILLILGVLFLLTPVSVAPEMLHFDLWILGAVTLLALPVMLTGRHITRLEGALFVALYCAFLWFQFDPQKQGLSGAGLAARAAVSSGPDPL